MLKTIITIKHTQVYRYIKFPMYDVHKFMLNNPDVMYVTIQRVVRGLDGFISKLTAQMQGSAEQKIGVELLLEAKRFHAVSENVRLDINVSELSARTGLARETVSRNVSQMLVDGLITKTSNKICVVDVARLKEALVV